MLHSIFTGIGSSIELTSLLVCIGCSIFLGVIIAFTYRSTGKYSKNFLITLSMLPLLVEAVIVMVNGNLGTSVAILGAFSLVKFRSLPGTSKEILCVFFAMTVGLACGMGHIFYATIITFVGCILILLFSKVNIFEMTGAVRELRILMPENLDYTDVFDDIFKKYTSKVELEKVKTTNMGSLFDLRYRVTMKSKANEKKFIDELRVRNGNLKIVLSHGVDDNDL